MSSWHLVYTKPKNEDPVSHKFVDAGLQVLNPKLKERKIYRRKLQEIVSPLFPCYIFVKFNDSDYRLVKYTRGVKSIVGNSDSPGIVPEEIINSITERMEEGVIAMEQEKFKHGEEVVIKAGPFEGIKAVFDKELKGSDRVSILLASINAKAVVDRAFLAKSN